MLIHCLGNGELGAHAVGASCKDWLFVFAELKQSREATESTHYLWTGSALSQWSEKLNGAVAFFNVDACRGVSIFRHVRSNLSVLLAEQSSHSVSIGVSGRKSEFVVAIKASGTQGIDRLVRCLNHLIYRYKP